MPNQRELIQHQLERVIYADLSHYDATTRTYYIPLEKNIQIRRDHSYLIRIKSSVSENEILKTNYNNGQTPPAQYYLVDVIAVLKNVIKINGVEYDINNSTSLNSHWSGYLALRDIEVLKEM